MRTIVCVVAAVTAAASGQAERPPSVEDAARRFNADVRRLQEEMDALIIDLGKPNLSAEAAAAIKARRSGLQRRAEDLWAAAQADVNAAFRQTREDILEYNRRNRRLEFESAAVGGRIDLLNNVIAYPTRDGFERNREAMSQAWEKAYGSRLKPFGEDFARDRAEIFKSVKERFGIDLDASGYARVGTSNPYTNEAYYRYYDKDGRALWVQWKDDAEGWRKYRDDVEAYRRRRRDEKEALERQASAASNLKTAVERSRIDLARRLKEAAARAERAGQPADNGLLGVWSYSDGRTKGPVTFDFRPEGRLSITLPSGTVQDGARWWNTGANTYRVSWNGTSNFEDFTVTADGMDSDRGRLRRLR